MSLRAILVPLSLALALPALGQGVVATAVSATSDPARADGPRAPLVYRSPFEGYRPHRDVTPGPWRAMNDEVARIGGWKAYAREAHDAAASKSPADGRSAPAAGATPPPRAP